MLETSSNCLINKRYVNCSITSRGFVIPPVQNISHILSTWFLMAPVNMQYLPKCHLLLFLKTLLKHFIDIWNKKKLDFIYCNSYARLFLLYLYLSKFHILQTIDCLFWITEKFGHPFITHP